ncbi:hypothetical protein MicloDRAFT_00035560 [Microvirga lotononidis]|uniref:Uncharacterized protein n=1 Tax=Microvirga lotononidis TaxID=864069 RepID=I4YSR0_9HYPH|nr:hypothetical protein MicloDRAFT_00035560 [Microvirga lotononidis]
MSRTLLALSAPAAGTRVVAVGAAVLRGRPSVGDARIG